ncbi:MAG: lysophospholipid acyltransferase family protein [Armatimonadota bacterium]
MLYYIGRFLLGVIYLVFGRLKVVGREHVPPSGGAIFAPNHTSYADPPLVGVASPRPIWFMAKAELFTPAWFGRIISTTHAFPVKRGGADRQAIRHTQQLLSEGKIVNIFIEGTRSPDGVLQSPELGVAMFALRAGVPIVPVAVINSDKLLPRHSIFPHFSRVKVVFGEPLSFPELAGKHADRQALTMVSEAVARRLAELLRTHGAPERVPEGYLEGNREPVANTN